MDWARDRRPQRETGRKWGCSSATACDRARSIQLHPREQVRIRARLPGRGRVAERIVGELGLQYIPQIYQTDRPALPVLEGNKGSGRAARSRGESQHFARPRHRQVVVDRVGLTGEIVGLRNVLLVMQIGGAAAESSRLIGDRAGASW
jgi:hypothetical protein